MKWTKKYTAALKAARKLGMYRNGSLPENAQLYQELELKEWYWVDGEWSNKPRSTSMFQTDSKAPAGVVRLRLMAHPNEIEEAINRIKLQGARVVETSLLYPNRRGIGVRVYMTIVLDQVTS